MNYFYQICSVNFYC